MKTTLVLSFFALTAALFSAQTLPEQLEPRLPRKIVTGKKPVLTMVKDGKVNFEIVVPADAAPSVKFAGNEAAELLGKAFGTKLKVLKKASGKCPAIILGSPEYAAKLGIDVNQLDRDGFVIRTFPGGVLIAGHDDPQKTERELLADHATIFGTYDFLERFAGMKFYLPGDYGTIIPKMKNWTLPEIDIYERPDFLQRDYSDYSGKPGSELAGKARLTNNLRNRRQTRMPYRCHSLQRMAYGNRFGSSHPEYFALQSNGKRCIDNEYTARGHSDGSHFCYSSKFKDEVIADILSYFKGEPASVRGIINTRTGKVGWNSRPCPPGGKFYSVCPPDGVKKCLCPKCAPEIINGTPKQIQEHYWRFFRDVAQAVKDSGVTGTLIIPCNYGYWRGDPPDFDIPDNAVLHFFMHGPWSELTPRTRDPKIAELKAWAGKGRGKLLLWTYPGKYKSIFPGIPATTPHYANSFFQRVRPYVLGCYFESYTDRLFFYYLDFYIYGKILWNPDVNVEELLNEHHRLLFGPAAPQVKEFFDSLERNWMKIAGHVVETSLGPLSVYPSEMEMWKTIYTPAERARMTGLLDQAEKAVAGQKEYLARLKTLRREMWKPLLDAAERFSGEERAIAEWTAYMPETARAPVIDGKLNDPAWKQAKVLTLIPTKKGSRPVKVRSTVRTLRDKDYFYFAFDCEYPGVPNTVKRPFDNQDLWKDAGVEVYLSPDKKIDRCYQIMVNASGSVADLVFQKETRDWSWNSGAEAKSVITPGKGWTTEIRIPRSGMEPASESGMLANFTRNYNPPTERAFSYVWGPFYLIGNNEITHFGTLRFQPDPRVNLIKDGDFDREPDTKKPNRLGVWRWRGKGSFPVAKDFLVAGRYSALLDSEKAEADGRAMISVSPDLKPDTEYELTFFVKMEKVKSLAPQSSGFYVKMDDRGPVKQGQCFPHRSLSAFSGTVPWTFMTFRFRTSPQVVQGRNPNISFVLRKAEGRVWIDHVRLFEIKVSGK